MGVFGSVSRLEASSEYAPVVTFDEGDWEKCEAAIESLLVRRGSSGIGLSGCEVAVRGNGCPAATVGDILVRVGRVVRYVPRQGIGLVTCYMTMVF